VDLSQRGLDVSEGLLDLPGRERTPGPPHIRRNPRLLAFLSRVLSVDLGLPRFGLGVSPLM
jgi:hypothetical protein